MTVFAKEINLIVGRMIYLFEVKSQYGCFLRSTFHVLFGNVLSQFLALNIC